MASRWWMVQWGIALAALMIGASGALIYGFWGVDHDCYSWVDGHDYQLVQNDWWAKDRGCVAKTRTGEEIVHSEDLGSKAKIWVWQFAIFALGALPAAAMIFDVSRRSE